MLDCEVRPPATISTGLAVLDQATGGGRSGQAWLVAGPAGVGVSDLALGLARAAALRSHLPVAWLTTRQQPEEVAESVLLAEAGVLLHRERDGVLSDDQAERLVSIRQTTEKAPLDCINVPEEDIINRASEAIGTVAMVVIDGLSTVGPEVLVEVRDLADRAGTWVVVVLSEDHLDRRVLRGLVPQANLAVWIERPDVEDPTTDRVGEADLFLLRQGRRTAPPVVVAHQARYRRFLDISR